MLTSPPERVDTARVDPGSFLGPGSFNETTASNSSFSVGQAARVVGVSPSTVRLWEQQGLVRPSRRQSGHRRFTSDDIRHLRRVRDARDAQRTAFQEIDEQLRLGQGGTPPDVVSDQDGGASRIGARLRTARFERGVSLRELARRTGLSASYASAIERGHARPTVAALQKLTAGLGLTLNSLAKPSVPACTLVRVVDAKMLDIGVSGVRIDNLAAGAKILEPQLFTLAPGAGS